MPTYVFSVQDEIGERRLSVARLVILSLCFLSMHWVLRDPKESEIVVFRKARIGVMEDGRVWCGAKK